MRISDWSSDVCSSDLELEVPLERLSFCPHPCSEHIQDRACDGPIEIPDEEEFGQTLKGVADRVDEGGIVAVGEDGQQMLAGPHDIVVDRGVEIQRVVHWRSPEVERDTFAAATIAALLPALPPFLLALGGHHRSTRGRLALGMDAPR